MVFRPMPGDAPAEKHIEGGRRIVRRLDAQCQSATVRSRRRNGRPYRPGRAQLNGRNRDTGQTIARSATALPSVIGRRRYVSIKSANSTNQSRVPHLVGLTGRRRQKAGGLGRLPHPSSPDRLYLGPIYPNGITPNHTSPIRGRWALVRYGEI
jgi:hypothetical protein